MQPGTSLVCWTERLRRPLAWQDLVPLDYEVPDRSSKRATMMGSGTPLDLIVTGKRKRKKVNYRVRAMLHMLRALASLTGVCDRA